MAITKASSSAVAPAAKGDLVVGNATNDSGVLAVGSTDQVLTVDSSTATGLKWATASALPSQTGNSGKYLTTDGSAASWGTVATGGMTLLSTTSFSGTSTTISSINQSYINLVVIIENWYKSSSGDWPAMQWNGQTGGEYSSSSFQQNTTTGGLNGQTGQSICRISPNQFDTSATGSIIQITFPSYSAVTPNVPFWVCQTSPNANYGTFGFGNYSATGNAAALTSITLRSGTLSNNNNGTIKIYGVK
jgi:hypothetical protein